jgi:lipoprotein NlpD
VVTPSLGAENAGKPGYHTVKPGETLTRIAIQYGQDRRNIQAWNQLSNPDLIEVGQVLRVAPPQAVAPVAGEVASAPVVSQAPAARPLPSVAATAPTAAPTAAPAPAKPAAPSTGGLAGLSLVWPVQGDVITRFDEKTSRGIAIAGRLGDPVVAAADGVVAIAGSPIRGLGNLVIIQHAGGVITAYAHNQTLLVKEDQQVRQGQRIAEMGSSDSDRVKLHFEVRHQGKPVDPLAHLPKR